MPQFISSIVSAIGSGVWSVISAVLILVIAFVVASIVKSLVMKLLGKGKIDQLLGKLDDREMELIRMRYFQDKTQVEVAKHMGISQVQVSRMEKRILLQLREEV